MKKLLFVFLVLAVLCGSVFAFDPLSYPPPLYGGGNVLIDAGIGYWYTNWASVFGKLSIPPVFVNVEYALPGEFPISVGGGVSFFQWKFNEIYYDYALTSITPQARASWHWGFDVSWLDLYTGISLGYSIVHIKWGQNSWASQYTPAGSSGLYWGTHVGAHFYFTDNVGAMIEAGYPSLIKAGLTFKFGGRGSGGSGARGMGTATVTTDVNMRTGPSLDYPVIRALPQGTVVTLTGEISDGWTQVRHNGQTGWVSSPYITTRQ